MNTPSHHEALIMREMTLQVCTFQHVCQSDSEYRFSRKFIQPLYLLVSRDSHASAILHRIELHLDGIIHEGPSEPSHASWPLAGFGQVWLFPGYYLDRYRMQPLWRTDRPLTQLYRKSVTQHFTPTGTFPE